MAKKSLKCPKCDRTFSMPAHLARHTSTIHGVRARPKAAGKRRPKVTTRGRAGRPKTPARRGVGRPKFTVGEAATRLMAEMQAYHSELLGQRATLDGELAGLATAMNVMGGTVKGAAPKKTRRPRRASPAARRGRTPGRRIREGSLTDYVVKVLRQTAKPMSPGDISNEVVKAGYRSAAKDLAKAVSNTLAKVKQVKRVERGMYRL